MRIVKTRYKVAYFVVGIGLLTVVTFVVVRPVVPEGLGRSLIQLVTVLALYAGAVRWFRGPGEDVTEPRPWWRASNRPMASFVLGVLSVLSLVSGVYQIITGLDRDDALAVGPLTALVGVLQDAFLAWYFLTSGIRLHGMVAERREDDPPLPSGA